MSSSSSSSSSMTLDEMRAARLRALGQQQAASTDGGNAAAPAAVAPSDDCMGATQAPPPAATWAAVAGGGGGGVVAAAPSGAGAGAGAGVTRRPTEEEMAEMRALLWPPTATEDDLARWHQQGFVLQEAPPFGLAQGHGGPCGVLAAVQSELLRLLIFGESAEPPPALASAAQQQQLPSPSRDEVIRALAGAMAAILQRARPTPREVEEAERAAQAGGASGSSSGSGGGHTLGGSSSASASAAPPTIATATGGPGQGPIHLAVPAHPDALPLPAAAPTPAASLSVRLFADAAGAAAFVASEPGVLAAYQSPSGVMLFVLSLLMTRGAERVKGEMDDVGNALTGRFGHCTQELLNLLLVGRAVSNVFDGEKELGDSGLKLRGISARPTIGYLTHLETLRYVQVGSHYKTPLFPIWVVGSSSHFTVLFALDKGCNEESEAEQLLAKAQRAFSAFDPSEGGFIQAADLQQVLIELDLLAVALDERAHERLKARLEMPGSGGLVLWQDFWQAVSQLLTGVGLDDYLSGKTNNHTTTSTTSGSSGDTAASAPAPQASASSSSSSSAASQSAGGDGRPRSDSDIARELQAHFDAGGDGDGGSGSGSNAGAMAVVNDDDEAATQALIRQLQAEDAAAGAGGAAIDVVPAGPPSGPVGGAQGQGQPVPPPPSPSGGAAGGSPPAQEQEQQQALQQQAAVSAATTAPSGGAETYIVYHYNGLAAGGRPSRLARFSLTKRPPASSGALVGGRAIAFGTSPMGSGAAFSCPIEEVLATKWPGARFNWHGQPPPSID